MASAVPATEKARPHTIRRRDVAINACLMVRPCNVPRRAMAPRLPLCGCGVIAVLSQEGCCTTGRARCPGFLAAPLPTCPLARGRATVRTARSRASGSRAGTSITRSIYHTPQSHRGPLYDFVVIAGAPQHADPLWRKPFRQPTAGCITVRS